MKKNGSTLVGIMVTLIIVGILVSFVSRGPIMGIAPFGPSNTVNVQVIDKYVDLSGSKESQKSHYMVSTDKGVFEVDNSIFLGIFNADEIYGRLQKGSNYIFNTKGNKVATWYMQEYPLITSVQ